MVLKDLPSQRSEGPVLVLVHSKVIILENGALRKETAHA